MTSIKKDTLRTTVMTYIGIVLGYINRGFLFLIILTEEQIGIVGLLLTVGTLFANISGFGVAFTAMKFLPFFKNFERHHFGFFPFILRMVIWGSLITSIAFFVFRVPIENLYIDKSAEFVNYYWWLYPIGIGYVFHLLFDAYLRGFSKNIVAVFSLEILYRAGIMLFLFLYWFRLISFDTFIALQSLIYLMLPIILMVQLIRDKEFIVSRKYIQISQRFKKLIVQFSAYNYINTLGKAIVISLDVMMIAQMVGLEGTGVYTTVMAFVQVMLVPSRALTRVSIPVVSQYWKTRNLVDMQSLYQKTSGISLFLTLAGFIALWLNIDLLFSFLKPSFQIGIWVFFILMMGRFFELFFDLTEVIFSTSKKYKYDIYFTIALVGIVIGLNLVFIPKWGIIGAAVSTSIAWIVYTLGRFLVVYKVYGLTPFHRNHLIIIGLAIGTLFVADFVGDMAPNLWYRILIVMPLFVLLFLLPVWWLKLEPRTAQYVSDKLLMIRKKLSS